MRMLTECLAVASESLQCLLKGRFSTKEFIQQLHDFAIGSLAIIVFCVTFVGIIITLEYSHHMKMILHNDALIPGFAMIMLARELAPVVTALLLTAKMGASIAAEIGAMKSSEQLDAYRLLGLNRVELFVLPKILASAMATSMLSIISLFVAVLGTLVAAVTFLDFTVGSFLQSLFVFVSFSDVLLCFVKAFLFGMLIPLICATYGFQCRFGAEGVGLATTDAVVATSMSIIILDFILTYLYSLII